MLIGEEVYHLMGFYYFCAQTKTMDPRERKYSNGEITVYWKPRECIHSSVCYMNLLEVFNPRKRPWVNMSGASTRKIIDVVNQCPTEALTWKWNDEEKNKTVTEADTNHIKFKRPHDFEKKEEDSILEVEQDEPLKIRVMKNGPYIVEGSYVLTRADGSEINMMGMSSFCRCGNSNSMPFCDGNHRKTGFKE
ncbi:MAG: (4Fe-4S)-binding protein [Bacteroidales bacterium]|nr:MAG: (4Fe-4S)-binding protein [Bacteroidales bacterium]